jgi:hypothetical protein
MIYLNPLNKNHQLSNNFEFSLQENYPTWFFPFKKIKKIKKLRITGGGKIKLITSFNNFVGIE